ncbi:hypothetical protein [Rosistilla oblonga]|uniref:hypothetical protein n=1 Tax=Rosistilla oblonga TaxID=2527990 RepID=UPI003A987311
MQVYAFTVQTNRNSDSSIVDSIYSVCDDATASVENGKLAIAFDRRADTLEQAIREAVDALRSLAVDVTSVTLDVESLAVLN